MRVKTVRISVEGGVVQHVEVPKGVQVIISDYDVDAADAECLSKGVNGDLYAEAIWDHDG